jgi:hypothetical protein
MVLLAAHARAADDPQMQEAMARFAEGNALHDAGREEEAYIKFTQAYAVYRRASVVFNLARTEQLTGRIVDAVAHYREYIAKPESETDANVRAKARANLVELAKRLGRIDVTAPAGSTLLVDGKSIGIAPLGQPLDVLAGKHTIEARNVQGSKTREAIVVAGSIATVAFAHPETALPPASTSKPATTPASATEAAPPAKDSVSADTNHKGFFTPKVITSGAIFLGAIAGAGLGWYFGSASNSDSDRATELRSQLQNSGGCPPGATSSGCIDLQDTVDSQHREATLSKVFWITGGVLAIGALATWFMWPSQKSARAGSLHVLPWMAAGVGGAAAVGSF